MAGVVFIFVREDASEVETLAEAFDDAGYAITGSQNAELCVVVWSRRAMRSETFRAAADNAFRTGRAIVAALFAPPSREEVFETPVVDLSQWDGVDTLPLTPLFDAADEIVHPIEVSVITLPSRAVCEDAEFVEAPQMIASGAPKTTTARQAWETPLPTKILRAVPDEPPAEFKLGASKPRRDFRRVGARRQQRRAHAALVFAVLAILGGGAFVASVAANTADSMNSAEAKAELGGGVSLTSANAESVGLVDVVPDAPAEVVGRRGVEPPSARTVHRARYEP
ncbi:MAG: hypothetical protein IPL62_19855 [Caulobacteraceae bacterium]|nr:hypothetical protein [Caulobacteraceae bacterium]